MTEAEVQAARRDAGAIRTGRSIWSYHPTVRSEKDELTAGERAADWLRNGMGSWAFVFGALLFLAVWMWANETPVVTKHWDPYPFILLNLTLSCLAALQGAILLIAAKRTDQIASELAMHDLESDLQAEEILRTLQGDFARMMNLIVEIHGRRPSVIPDQFIEAPPPAIEQP